MRRWLNSLRGRLLVIAGLSTGIALVFAAFAIGHVLERFVMRGLDDRLDAQVMVLARAIDADGTLDESRAIDLPSFGDAGSDWRWRVDGPGGRHWASHPDAPIVGVEEPDDHDPGRGHDRDRIRATDRDGPGGARLHFRSMALQTAGGPVVISASGPRRIIAAPLREALVPLLGSLAILGAGLGLATLLQLRIGLRPLSRLRRSLADVRAGRARHVSADQPEELSGIVTELNALIDQNAAGLATARRHVSNLAHGMKTPLAALAIKLEEQGRDADGTLGDMVAQIDARIRHHLARARAATPAGHGRNRTPLGPAMTDLIAVLDRVHADDRVVTQVEMPNGLALAVDPQDLDEMLGNLLDNARRHARKAIAVSVVRDGGNIRISIEDDGAGLSDMAMRVALVPGQRLDEAGEGYGFGLSIVQELAEMNGGTLSLGRSARTGWGLAVRLTLPSAGDA